jgi:trehalose 6-phosphate synthase
MPRLVVVSNRVPLPSERGPRAGGLAVALTDALRPGTLWFGWSGRHAGASGPPCVQQAAGITYATIDLTDAEYRAFYVHFSNGALWPLLHLRLGLITFRREDYEGYRDVNKRFADSLAPMLRPDDLIWAHDYHLIPFAEELRLIGVRNRVGFFLHTPFVPPAILIALPRAVNLLRALCAYDVIGFHTRKDRYEFVECVREILGIIPQTDEAFEYQGRTVQLIVNPIGIDAAGFARTAVQAAAGADAKRLRASLGGRALAIGVDRLDYSKGLSHRFEAFAALLEQHPEHRREVNFLQIAARSREDSQDYQRLRRELDRLVGEINGRFSEFDWAPIRYMTRAVRRQTLAGFMRMARLAVVTPLRDGMNLVAKEFIAAQDPADPGVLILSRFAGAAEDLNEALIVNPLDADEIAEAMRHGLTMSLGERQERHQSLRAKVWENTAARFCAAFLSHLSDEPAQRPRQPPRVKAAS